MQGCKKDDGGNADGEYYIRFKANGSAINYNNQQGLYFNSSQTGNLFIATISGFNDASSNISLQIYDTTSISNNSYSGYTISPVGQIKGVIIGYLDKSTGQIYNTAGATTDAVVTITALEENSVKGTFSGTVRKSGFPDIVISEGAFVVKNND